MRSRDVLAGQRAGGFTMIELIMVIVILGVLSAMVVMSWPRGVALAGAAQQLAQDLRYAQNLAMNRGSGYQLAKVDADSYRILSPSNVEISRGDLEGGVMFPSSFSSLSFDGLGKPSSSMNITLTDGSDSLTLAVSSETGMVSVP